MSEVINNVESVPPKSDAEVKEALVGKLSSALQAVVVIKNGEKVESSYFGLTPLELIDVMSGAVSPLIAHGIKGVMEGEANMIQSLNNLTQQLEAKQDQLENKPKIIV